MIKSILANGLFTKSRQTRLKEYQEGFSESLNTLSKPVKPRGFETIHEPFEQNRRDRRKATSNQRNRPDQQIPREDKFKLRQSS